jgi:prepilin-type N-terminal cleavage/methylation domain-containing protein
VKRRGFSLVEALVALVLLLVALIPMAALPAATSRLYIASAAREQAALLAVQKLEELEAKELVTVESSDILDGYKVAWTVGTPVNELREVKVTVTWGGGRGKVEVTRQVSAGAYRTST